VKGPIQKSEPITVDHLCIDMNQLLHSSVHSTNTKPNRLIFKIFSSVDGILKLIHPRKSLGEQYERFFKYFPPLERSHLQC